MLVKDCVHLNVVCFGPTAMIKRLSSQLLSKDHPKWFTILNMCIMLPILLWPLVFYTTIFFFDNPQNLVLTYMLFFAVNVYPIYLVIIAYLNSILFQKNKIIGSMLPTVILLVLIFGVTYIGFEMHQNSAQNILREKERAKQGYVKGSNDYKVINNRVYHRDTLITGADANTFEIVSWNWQRDKNYYYFFGRKVKYIDRQTFKDLDYHYGKDKYNVYYDEKIIKGADAGSFKHIDGSQDGKDANNCYRWGKKVDCKVLNVEE